MGSEYDEPMHFDPTLLPASAVVSGHQGLWDYGIEVAGKPKKYAKQTLMLEAAMYGFKGEELLGVKGYLYRHRKYQLIPVSELAQSLCMVWKEALSDQWSAGHAVIFLP